MKILKSITLTICLFTAFVLTAQNFEGIVEFKRTNYYDETNYIYYISPSKVRIDELKKDGSIAGTMLINFKTKEVIAINHDRKMYMDIKSTPSVKDMSNCETFKTSEKKVIIGHNCTKWTVKNADFKSKATYCVIDKGNYFFFKDLLSALNRKDKIGLYFMQIPENAGYFPIMGEEVGDDGKLKAKMETTKITKKKIDASMFNIPSGYQKFSGS